MGNSVGSPATGALLRDRGNDADGQPWSLFVKVLQHVRHWVLLPMLRAEFAEEFAAEFCGMSSWGWKPAFANLLPRSPDSRWRIPAVSLAPLAP